MNDHCDICSNRCFGIENYDGSCCSVEDRDFIIGPHTDCDRFINDLSEKLGREVNYSEIFIDYEEGSSLFQTKTTWQNELNYPALRVNLHHPKKHCIFYNPTLRYCTVYDIRPKTCEEYECWYLSENKPKN
jgi:Fe-S-cluster containining protein